MKRGDKIIVFVDMLGFASLTEKWPRWLVRSRKGQTRITATSGATNQLSMFHTVFDQTVEEFQRLSSTITAMSFSDCAFALVGTPLLTADFAAELMQHFICAGVPVRMGVAAGTFWPGRLTTDLSGRASVSRAIFHGTAIVRSNQAEGCGEAGMRIFVHESLEGATALEHRRPILRFPKPLKGVIGEMAYLYHDGQYRNARIRETVESDDRALWDHALRMKRNVGRRANPRVKEHYAETLAALNRMRQKMGRSEFAG